MNTFGQLLWKFGLLFCSTSCYTDLCDETQKTFQNIDLHSNNDERDVRVVSNRIETKKWIFRNVNTTFAFVTSTVAS